MSNFFTIGEVSKITNISTKALRNYDHLGLLKPCYIDPNTNYRYYSYDQFFQIDVIKYLNKGLLIPLSDIKNILTNKEHSISNLTNISEIIKFLNEHKNYLDEKISQYESSKKIIDTIIEDIKTKYNSPSINVIFEQYFLPRTLYYTEISTSINDIDKNLNRYLIDYNNLNNTETNTMCLLCSLSDFQKTHQFNIKGFGIISNKPIENSKSLLLPAGRYITYKFHFSEKNSIKVLHNINEYLINNDICTNDNIILFSNIVDLIAKNKYEYIMEFQILHYL